MNHTVMLTVRYAQKVLNLTNRCVSFRLEKERYTPYTELHGKWFCPAGTEIAEVVAVILYIDGKIKHYGYPTSIGFSNQNGCQMLEVSSLGYSAQLLTNQCPDGLVTDVNLTSLVAKMPIIPGVTYQAGTPTVNYVNYYDGTSAWDAIVAYSLRAGGHFPYLQGYNMIRTDPAASTEISLMSNQLASRQNGSDYQKLISRISEKDVDGTPDAFVITNGLTTSRLIVRTKEINFDREWIMDPDEGLKHRINYSMRAMFFDSFSWRDYTDCDLLDSLSVGDAGFKGEIDRIRITASAKNGFVTTVWCYHDGYCV